MIVLIGGEKGGTGKSTLATNLCAYLAAAGQDVLLLDADRQSTSANWAAERGRHPELAAVHCVQRYGNLFKTVQDLRTRYAHIVIDAGGRDSEELRSAMVLADKLYSPAKASQSDLWTVDHLARLVELAHGFNPRLEARVLISMAPTNPRINEEHDAVEMLAEFAERLLPSRNVTRERKAYRDAMGQGKGVIEMNDNKAINEIALIAKEIYGEIQIETRSAAGAA
ncbi:MAG: AAA family ATPase [Polyangiaceae bacterium]|nr:AAA family ATPase [Polyangiaceae bacterium]